MAEPNDEELERKATASQSRGVALADESPDELPALLALAVGVAILVITLVWPSIRDRDTSADDGGQEVAAAAEAEPEEEAEPEAEPEVALPDIPLFQSELGIAGLALSNDGNVVIAEGEVPDEATRASILEYLNAQPNVDSVTDRMTIAEVDSVDAAVSATAAQASIILEGTVPDEETRDALVARAAAVYSEAQVEDRLLVDPGAQLPVTVSILGSLTDEVLYNQVLAAFDGMDGVTVGDQSLTLAASGELESSLNSLEPIQFASGSSIVEASSQPILDQAAEFLNAEPDTAVEIGGHTDSIGGEEANQQLSQDRADSVMAALTERGVTNPMTAVGFGERRLRVSPDENDPEAQRANRRIEFRVLN